MTSIVSSSWVPKLTSFKSHRASEPGRCNFCGKPLPGDHRHLLNVIETQLMCACEICSVLESARAHLKLIPQRYAHLKNLTLSDELWADLMIPVNMAFFVFSSVQNGIVVYYPAAAGVTESKLKMEAGNLAALNPWLNNLTLDVEALLVNRLDEPEYFIVPIDCCYKLIGIIPSNWKGISGGREVHDATRKFFNELKEKTNA
jgi:hypothetical protein